MKNDTDHKMECGANTSTTIAVRVPKPLRAKLEQLADIERRTLGNFVRLHLEKLVETGN